MVSSHAQIVRKIQLATDAVIQQIAESDDAITGAVVGRNTSRHLVINSSFFYRDSRSVKTIQSPRRLVARLVTRGKHIQPDNVSIIDSETFHTHYRLLPPQDASGLIPLASALTEELASVGDLIFILIGTVKGLRPCIQAVDSTAVKELRLVPSQAGADVQRSEPGVYSIRSMLPIEDLLDQINQDISQHGGFAAEDRLGLVAAYDKMLDIVTTEVIVPTNTIQLPDGTVLGQIVTSLRNQASEYSSALAALQSAPDDRRALNEVLRIAYNFSADVLPLVSLFMSICDLKPLVFWCTVKEQWALHQAFTALPWKALGRKEKLEEYKSIVSQARSHAFHHVLPFDSTVEVDLSTLDVRAETIRLFVPFGQKEGRGVHLKDQKLADVLAEFSRAKERPVSSGFWWANLNVMQATCRLAQGVLETLVLIHEARES